MPHCGGLKNLSGTVGETTLTVKQLAMHIHQLSAGTTNKSGGSWQALTPENSGAATQSSGGSQPHTHTLSGASGAADSLPPYYALSYIMRIA